LAGGAIKTEFSTRSAHKAFWM